MNKAELIDAIAKKASLKKVDAKKFYDAFLDVTSTSLVSGDKVILFGFGTFSVVERAARIGRNPHTGTSMNVPAKKFVKFKAGSELRGKIE
ncbi:MAG: HU family DNA-binding protein [Prevotellaceae bacterium]|jgi:DNA-binding protein HU-beta|nr:HU family DNA-binding protein [Prevotellaceae bacterium]